MTVFAKPNANFSANFQTGESGLVGDVFIQVVKLEDKDVALPRTNAGISEFPEGSGIYVFTGKADFGQGQFLLVWDVKEESFAEEDLSVSPIPPGLGVSEDIVPTVDEVAAFLRSRTQGRFDEEGTFNSNTRPTDQDVLMLITQAVEEVTGHVGDLEGDTPCLPRMRSRAKSAVVIYTSMLIELGYFSEQTSGAFSPYDRMEKLYNSKMKVLKEAVAECIGGGAGESVGGGESGGGMPSGDFGDLEGVGERDW